jgi:arginyl-tRNA synthetase
MTYPTVAPISFCKASQHSQNLCSLINNLYKEGYNTEQISNLVGIGKSSVRYYYYGIHNCPEAHFHWKNAFNANKELGYIQYSLNQVRVGTSVPI